MSHYCTTRRALYRCSVKYTGLLQTRSYTLLEQVTSTHPVQLQYLLLTSNHPHFAIMVSLQLLDLPNELLITISSNLPACGILAFRASCHRLRAVIEGSMLLRGRIWSGKHGIQEILPSGLLPPDFIANVQQWENDWFRFRVGEEVATHSMHRPSRGSPGRESLCPTNCNFLIRSGYLIQMRQKENPGWSHMHLPPLLRKSHGFIKNPVWTDVRLGDHLTMEGWALDLDQDLVAASLLS
jgi:hypothetical protein